MRFVSDISEGLIQGQSVAVRLPEHHPLGLASAIRSEIGNPPWKTIRLNEFGDERPIDVLYAVAVPGNEVGSVRSVESLLASESFAGCVYWIEDSSRRVWPLWKEFLQDYEYSCRSQKARDRATFCIPLVGDLALDPPKGDIGLTVHSYDGVASYLDTQLYAALLLESRGAISAIHRRLMVALIATLAVWDPLLVEQLVQEDMRSLLAPTDILRSFAIARKWEELNTSTSTDLWHLGVHHTFDGTQQVHSAALAVSQESSQEIYRRVWTAEIGVILPFIEEQRRILLGKLKSDLIVPFETRFGEVITELNDLEIGHIDSQISSGDVRVDYGTRIFVENLRAARNALSHLETLSVDLVTNGLLSTR